MTTQILERIAERVISQSSMVMKPLSSKRKFPERKSPWHMAIRSLTTGFAFSHANAASIIGHASPMRS